MHSFISMYFILSNHINNYLSDSLMGRYYLDITRLFSRDNIIVMKIR